MKKILAISLGLIIMLVCLAGCGSAPQNSVSDSAEYRTQESPVSPEAEAEGIYQSDEAKIALNESAAEYGQKIVYTSTFYIETLKYDDSYRAIQAALSAADGHIAYSSQSGGQTSDGYYNQRRAYLELKVPVEAYENFLNQSGTFGNVTSRSDSAQDITSSYIDVEARLSALQLQEERLLELLNQAQDIETLLQIESRLSEVRYEIELYTAQKNTYDNMVSFCTVTIDLVEVSTMTPARTKGFWQELGDAIVGSFQSIVAFLRGLVIVLIYILPYALIAAGLYFLLVRPLVKAGKKKREALYAQQRAGMQTSKDSTGKTSISPYTSLGLDDEQAKENKNTKK